MSAVSNSTQKLVLQESKPNVHGSNPCCAQGFVAKVSFLFLKNQLERLDKSDEGDKKFLETVAPQVERRLNQSIVFTWSDESNAPCLSSSSLNFLACGLFFINPKFQV